MTAEDVIFSFGLIKKNPDLDLSRAGEIVNSVTKIGANGVQFILSKENSMAPNLLVKVPIVPKHIWSKVTDLTVFANENPVGSGPFTEITSFEPSGYLQCRNPNYWEGQRLSVECLNVPLISNNDQLYKKLAAGELDWSSGFVPDVDKNYASQSSNFHYWFPESGTTSFVLNFKSPQEGNREAINSLAFRQAFSLALDRQTLLDEASFGYGSPTTDASGICQSQEKWRSLPVFNKYSHLMQFDVEQAKKRLADAGFHDVNNDGLLESPSGKPIDFKIITPAGWDDFNKAADIAATDLIAIGIQAEATPIEFAELNKNMAEANYDISFTNYFYGPTPFAYFDAAFNSKYQKPEFGRYAMHHYQSDRIDGLLADYLAASGIKLQKPIINELQDAISSEMITIPAYCSVNFFQYNSKRFNGWWNESHPVGRPLIWDKVPERLLQVLDLKVK